MEPKKNKPQKIKIDPWVRSRALLVLLVLAMVAFTMWVSGPIPPKGGNQASGRSSVTRVAPAATMTAGAASNIMTTETEHQEKISEEVSDQASTSGIVIGTIVIVVIVFAGTLFTVWQSRERSNRK